MPSTATLLAPSQPQPPRGSSSPTPTPSLLPATPSPSLSHSSSPFFVPDQPQPFEKKKKEEDQQRRREAERSAFDEAKALYEAGIGLLATDPNPLAATLHFRQAAAVFSTLPGSRHRARRDKALWQAGMCFAREGVRVGRSAAREMRRPDRGGRRRSAEEGLEEARRCLEQARDLFHFLGETAKEAIALYQLGLFSATVAEAGEHLKSAAVLFAECGDEGREAMCYAELGNLFAAGEGGDPDSGIWFFKQALLLYLKLGDTVKEAHCLFSCGVLFARLPPPQPSSASSATSSPSLGASTSSASSSSHHTPNPTRSALAYLSQSATLFRKLKDRKGEAECRYQMGKVWARVGGATDKSGLERAVKEFEEASNLFLKAGSTTDTAWTYYRLSLVMLKVRSKELALDYLAEARKLFADAHESKAEGACLVRMAEMLRGGDPGGALAPGSKEEHEAAVADRYLEEAATLVPRSTFDRLTRSHSRSSAHVGRRGTIRLSASSPQLSSAPSSQLRAPPRLRTASSPDETSHGLEVVREEDEDDERGEDGGGVALARQGSERGLGVGVGRGGEAWWAVKDGAGFGAVEPAAREGKGKEREKRRTKKASA